MSTLHVGLIGLGVMGRNHARAIGATDGLTLSAVHDPTWTDESFSGARAFSTPESLLSSGIDCCVIAAPTSDHERLATLAAEHDVPTLVEKPLATDSAAANRLTALFADRGLVGMVGHIERFNPATMALKERVHSGELGDLYQLATRRQGPFPERIRDVGVIMDLATHDIDLTRWVSGSEYARLSAWTANKSGRANEDLVVAAGQMQSGLTVSHHVNWLTAAKERQTILTGEGGTLVADTLNADLYYYENGAGGTDWDAHAVFRGVGEGNMTRYALQRHEPLRSELEAFRDAVRGIAATAVTFADGATAVRVAEVMLESAASATIVATEPFT